MELQYWKKICSGESFSVGINNDGKIFSWGKNSKGAIGLGFDTSEKEIQQITPFGDWVDVACGDHHILALNIHGEVFAWGYNYFGQLGQGDVMERKQPTLIRTNHKWKAIAAGGKNSVLLSDSGKLTVLGEYHGGTFRQSYPDYTTDVIGEVDKIFCGKSNIAYINTKGELYLLGSDNAGQMTTIGHSGHSNKFIKVNDDTDWSNVVIGNEVIFAAKRNMDLYAWGSNDNNIISTLSDKTITEIEKVTSMKMVTFDVYDNSFVGVDTEGRVIVSGNEHKIFNLSTAEKSVNFKTTNIKFSDIDVSVGPDFVIYYNDKNIMRATGNNDSLQFGSKHTKKTGSVYSYRLTPNEYTKQVDGTTAIIGPRNTLYLKGDLKKINHPDVKVKYTDSYVSALEIGTVKKVSNTKRGLMVLQSDGTLTDMRRRITYSDVVTFTVSDNYLLIVKDDELYGLGDVPTLGKYRRMTKIQTDVNNISGLYSSNNLFIVYGDETQVFSGKDVDISNIDGIVTKIGINEYDTVIESIGGDTFTIHDGIVYNSPKKLHDKQIYDMNMSPNGDILYTSDDEYVIIDSTLYIEHVYRGPWVELFDGFTAFIVDRENKLYQLHPTRTLTDGTQNNKGYSLYPVFIGDDILNITAPYNGGILYTTTSGELKTAGTNQIGFLGNGGVGEEGTHTLHQLKTPISFDTSYYGICHVIDNNGDLYGWSDSNSILNPSRSLEPKLIKKDLDFIKVKMGDYHSVMLTKLGDVYSMGENSSGQLGLGTTADVSIPTKIPTVGGVSDISISNTSSFIMKENSLYVFGYGENYRLGDSDDTNVLVPTKRGPGNISFLSGHYIRTDCVNTSGKLISTGNRPGVKNMSKNYKDFNDVTVTNRIVKTYPRSELSLTLTDSGTINRTFSSNGRFRNKTKNMTNDFVDMSTKTLNSQQTENFFISNKNLIRFDSNRSNKTLHTNTAKVFEHNNKVMVIDGFSRVGYVVGDTVEMLDVGHGWSWIAMNTNAYILLREDGSMFFNGEDELGLFTPHTGNVDMYKYPGRWKYVSLSDTHAIAIDLKGRLFMWGKSDSGQLLSELSSHKMTPVPDILFDYAEAHNGYTIALSQTGDVYTIGLNDVGQCGVVDHKPNTLNIVSIPDNRPVVEIYSTDEYVIAHTDMGDYYGWGKMDK